jgi:hypothetical protein
MSRRRLCSRSGLSLIGIGQLFTMARFELSTFPTHMKAPYTKFFRPASSCGGASGSHHDSGPVTTQPNESPHFPKQWVGIGQAEVWNQAIRFIRFRAQGRLKTWEYDHLGSLHDDG